MADAPAAPAAVAAPTVRPEVSRDAWLMRGFVIVIGLYLVLTLAIPLVVMLSKSFQSRAGEFVGFANYARYFGTPALAYSIRNSFFVSILSTVITVPLAFGYVVV